MTTRPRILLLSAYRSDSHASWADWLVNHLNADWRVLELPGRYFRWRIRGNPLSWLDDIPALLNDWQPDHILATSMVDICTVRGLHPALAQVPVSLYFHENQFAYPVGDGQHSSVDPLMVQLYGALAADELLFNSRYNQRTFLEGVDALMAKMPDAKPESLSQRLVPKCHWLPVPVEPVPGQPPVTDTALPLLIWNHRWEYDKCPEALVLLVEELDRRGLPMRLALFGAGAKRLHPVRQQLQQQLGERVVASGFMPRDEYRHWLGQGCVVFSAARHEFQGLAMLEAVSAGAFPVVPDDLCYQEQYPPLCRYPSGDVQAAADRIERYLQQPSDRVDSDAVDVSEWLSPAVSKQWQAWLANITAAVT